MRSKTLFTVGAIGAVALSTVLAGCATPAQKAACYPISGWATPVFRCAGAAPVVAVAPPPPPAPEPEPAKPEPAPEPAPPPPPPPRAEAKADRIDLSETVQFETESAVLLDRSKTLLDDVARELNDHPEIRKVQIEGHTDSTAGNRHNIKLSRERVASVRSYLIGKGVDPKRLATKAFGETKPIASNKTEEGRAKNRRVDFRIMGRK
jgi:outer membrane protein OmpA-like peptidoglycan-associated protein